jgi:hypothetical protein
LLLRAAMRTFDVSAEFACDAHAFLRDGLSNAYKTFQVRCAFRS